MGAALCEACGIDPADPDTLILVDGSTVLRNSDAALAIYAGLGWPWRAARWLTLIPRGLRDPIYLWVARNRYRVFGRRETCWRAAPDQADRIL